MLTNLHITLRQIKLFESVARNKSFTKAAEELHLTQPAVSIQIKRLEENIEHKLLDTVGKKLFLTPAGEKVHRHCIDILDSLTELKTNLNSLNTDIRGELKIAVISPGKYFVPSLLINFLKDFPDVEPKVTIGNRSEIYKALQSNTHDLAITGRIPDDIKAVTKPFFRSDLVIAAPVKHPLVNKANIQVKDLCKYHLILRETGSGLREAMETLFNDHHLPLQPFMELNNTEAIKQTVMSGMGISVLPIHSIRRELKHKYITVLDVEGFPLPRSWYATYLQDVELSPAAKAFMRYLSITDIEELLDD